MSAERWRAKCASATTGHVATARTSPRPPRPVLHTRKTGEEAGEWRADVNAVKISGANRLVGLLRRATADVAVGYGSDAVTATMRCMLPVRHAAAGAPATSVIARRESARVGTAPHRQTEKSVTGAGIQQR